MSVRKTKSTEYHATDQEVVYKNQQLNLMFGETKEDFKANCSVAGRVSGTPGIVEVKHAQINYQDIIDSFSAAEKGAAKTFFKAMERTVLSKDAELSAEPYDGSDVFE